MQTGTTTRSISRRRRAAMPASLIAGLVTILSLLSGILPVARAQAAEPMKVVLNWSLQPRYVDGSGDGRPDPAGAAGGAAVQPTSWMVLFDACASTGHDPERGYLWYMSGPQVTTKTCRFSWQFSRQGSHSVSVSVADVDGNPAKASTDVVIKDHLIVSIGDSLASGEGNPEVQSSDRSRVRWQNDACHRSSRAGSALAAKQIEDSDDKTSVTFIHLACSGAQMVGGLLEPFAGPEGTANVPAQLPTLTSMIGDRSIDALVLSIGINDLNFLAIATKCVQENACWNWEQELVTTPLKDVRDRFARLGPELAKLRVPANRVFISEYPDNTHRARVDQYSQPDYCRSILEDRATFGLEMSYDENRWASQTVLTGLNREVKAAADLHHWRYVDHVADQYNFNGYCAGDDRWFIRYEESDDRQATEHGTLHPNGDGHEVLKNRYLAFLEPALAGLEVETPLTISAPHGYLTNQPAQFVYTVRNTSAAPVTAGIMAVPVRGPSGQNLDVACINGWNVTIPAGSTWECRASGSYSFTGQYLAWADWADLNGRWHAGQFGPAKEFRLSAPSAPVGTGTGLKGEYFDNANLTGLRAIRTDAAVDFDWYLGSPLPALAADAFSVRWTGEVQARYSEPYTFSVRADDGVRLWVNNQLLVDRWVDQGATEWSGTLNLTAGTKYSVRLEYYENGGTAVAQLRWASPSTPKQIVPATQLYAARPDVSLKAVTPAGHFLRHRSFLGELTTVSTALDRADATFRVVPGLADPSAVSLEAVNYPGWYLRHQNLRLTLQQKTDDALFRQDATFFMVAGLSDPSHVSFRSVNYPSHFIRHRNYSVYLEQGSDALFRQDSTFSVVAPLAQ